MNGNEVSFPINLHDPQQIMLESNTLHSKQKSQPLLHETLK